MSMHSLLADVISAFDRIPESSPGASDPASWLPADRATVAARTMVRAAPVADPAIKAAVAAKDRLRWRPTCLGPGGPCTWRSNGGCLRAGDLP